MTVAVVHVKPLGEDISVRAGETLMAAADRSGLHWPTVCGGHARCLACAVEVEWAEDVSEPGGIELAALARWPEMRATVGGTVRLACQLTVGGSAVVVKRGVRRR